MIKNLEIKNFKSIKHLKLDCKRVNVFIGKPNTGKSNILESLGVFSLHYGEEYPARVDISEFVRIEDMKNLFYEQDIREKVEVKTEDICYEIKSENDVFILDLVSYQDKGKGSSRFRHAFDNNGTGFLSDPKTPDFSPFKFYRFKLLKEFKRHEVSFLLPPSGENLLSILLTNKDAREIAGNVFSEHGFKVVLESNENKIKIQKDFEGVIGIVSSYPYSLASDTLQRIVFYLAAIDTNKNSILIFEEPEVHSFPYYTKFLGERIALNESNQYFITTHNPYLLFSILGKVHKNEIAIFVTYFENYQTRAKLLTQQDLTKVFDLNSSVFFNLSKFVEEE